MNSDATSEPSVPLTDAATILDVEIVVGVVKKLTIICLLYLLGYFAQSLILGLLILIIAILKIHQTQQKHASLQIARTIALGHEKDIILETLAQLPAWVKFSEIEKVEWLNRTFKLLWQQINDYAQDLVPKILEPAIQNYVSDFKFNHVVLGNAPLRVDGVKVYDSEDKRKIVMDLDISYAGDCYVTFQTFRFTGGIKDIQLHGRLRVVLTPLISKIPFIGGLQAYFMNPPHIDFDLIKVTQILDIPGIRNRIKNTAMNVINSMFLYPNAYSINLSKGVNVSKLAVFRTEGILRVHVVEAKNLVNKDLIGKSDPYVVLSVGSINVKTPVVQNSLNPKWDFWSEFEVVPNSELKIEVWDEDDACNDDFLGHAKIDISQVAKIGQSDMPIPLQGVAKGLIHLRLTWLSLSPDYKALDAMIKETELLSAKLHTALLMIYLESSLNLPVLHKTEPSPFVELEIENQIKQTDVEGETCEPVWDKGFTFLIHDPRRAVLHLRINDETSKKFMGEVFFKVDNLQNEPLMELKRHTFFCNKPSSDASICCSMKLRILKNEYVEKKDEDEDTLPSKLLKQGSTISTKSRISSNSVTTESDVFSEPETSYLEDEPVSNLGQIKLSLSYSSQRQRLVVIIHEINLVQKYPDHVDPYVRLILQTDKLRNNKNRTKTIKNNSKPILNETFDYLISNRDLYFSTISFEVKNEKGLFKKFLGHTVIALAKYDNLSEPFTDWFNLKSKKDTIVYHMFK